MAADDGGPSDQARSLAAAMELEADYEPIDVSAIGQVRDDYAEQYRGGAERALVRHELELADEEIGGIPCTRITSAAGTSNGTLFYVFGGAFITGSPFSDLPIIGALAERCRVEVVAPRYRLAPEHPWPAAVDDCSEAYRAVAESSPERLFVAGESAGGNLALVTVQAAVRNRLPLPDALALLSPAVDLRPSRELFGATLAVDPSLSHRRVLDVDRLYRSVGEPTDPTLSPLLGSMDGLPPTFITTGSRDLFLGMCLRLERRMRRAGVPVECRVWDGMWHVFEFYDEIPESAESLAEIATFLDAQ